MFSSFCYPKSCFFGTINLINGAKILALIDTLFNIIIFILCMVLRRHLKHQPSLFTSILAFSIFILSDILLSHGLKGARIVILIFWQTICLIHILTLIITTLSILVFGFPNLNDLIDLIFIVDTNHVFLAIMIVITFAFLALHIPYLIYFFRIVNGVKYIFRQISLEQIATRTSQRIIVRRLSQANMFNGRTIYLPSFDKKGKVDDDRYWIHQDISVLPEPSLIKKTGFNSFHSSKNFKADLEDSPLPVNSIYQVQPMDPMQPFMPLYSPKPHVDIISNIRVDSAASNSSISSNGFILPNHLRDL